MVPAENGTGIDRFRDGSQETGRRLVDSLWRVARCGSTRRGVFSVATNPILLDIKNIS